MTLTDLQPCVAERVWTVEEIPVLTARVSVPEPVSAADRISRRFRRYYQLQARSYLRYCETFLLPWAEAEYRAALSAAAPLPCFRAELDYCITYREGTLLSLYTQTRETTPDRRLLTRWGDTWDLAAGYPLPLTGFFPRRSGWKRQLLSRAEDEIRRQESLGIARYHTDLRHLLRRHFNPQNYYLTPEGLSFFYPMYAIAPAAEGIPVFTLPYGQMEPHTPPGAEKEPPSQ